MSLVGDSFRDYRTLVGSPIIPTKILQTAVQPPPPRTSDITIVPIEKPLSIQPLLKRKVLHDQARQLIIVPRELVFDTRLCCSVINFLITPSVTMLLIYLLPTTFSPNSVSFAFRTVLGRIFSAAIKAGLLINTPNWHSKLSVNLQWIKRMNKHIIYVTNSTKILLNCGIALRSAWLVYRALTVESATF